MKNFLGAPPDKRDFREGAEIILAFSGNSVRHRMFLRRGPKTFAGIITKLIREQYDFRIQKITHQQVVNLQRKAEKALQDAGSEKFKAGKRPDHDSLPPQIQALYPEALNLLQKMREINLQIRQLALHRSSCPDSDVYPFVKEICRLDDLRLKAWKDYDSFQASSK